MIVEFDKSFSKSLNKINDHTILQKIEKIILELEKADSLNEIKSIKKLSGFKNYYRIRVKDYRIGFETTNKNTIRLILIAHRKDIYRKFP